MGLLTILENHPLILNIDGSIQSTSETEVNSKKFQRQSDNAVVGEGDSIYDSRPDNLQYNELDKDCLYMQPCVIVQLIN